MIELNESAYNDTYIIAYINAVTNELGIDYTNNLAELLELRLYHDTHSETYQVIKIKKGKSK
jgi:hypothetical protein